LLFQFPLLKFFPPVQDFSVYPNSTQININLPPDPPTSAPQPQAGKGSVSGALYSYNMKIRIAGTLAYLTPAVGEKKDQVPSILTSPNPEQGDVYFTTDDKGNFELDNVSPGNYFLIVWSPYTWEVAQVSETDEKAMSIELQADQKTILGTVLVGWP